MNKKLLKNIAIIAAVLLLVGLYLWIKNKDSGEVPDLPVVTLSPTEQTALITEVTETETAVTEAPTESATAEPVSETEAPTPAPTACPVSEDGEYDTKDEVALYIYLYGHLPSNYIKKKEAQELGWPGGSLEPYAPGKSIGGDYFGNYEGLLPKKAGRTYTECDIGTKGKNSRGAKRIIFSNDGLIFYTDDHYESFTQITFGED